MGILLRVDDKLCHGQVTGVVDAKGTTKEQLGLMMTGAGQEGG